MNIEKLEAKIKERIHNLCLFDHLSLPRDEGEQLEVSEISNILTAIDAHLKEEKHKSWLEGKEDTIRLMRSGVELDKAIKRRKLHANIHPSATHGKEGEE